MLTKEVIEKIYFLCKQKFGDSPLAEDIAHDTMVGLLTWPSKENLSKVSLSFLRKIVYRYAMKQNGYNLKDHNHTNLVYTDDYESVTTTNPENQLIEKEAISVFIDALNTLPKKMLASVETLYYYERKLTRSMEVMVCDARKRLKKYIQKREVFLPRNCIYTEMVVPDVL